MDILTTLQALNACHGPSGCEGDVAAAITKLAAPFADEITTDTLGNLMVHKKGNGPKIMFSAHMDSIGFIVTHIEKEGFLRVGKVGGIHAADVLATPVRFQNGVRGLVSATEGVDAKMLAVDDLFIDIGAQDEVQAKTMVTVGDTAVYDAPAFAAGDRFISPYMDNRISCVVLLMALEALQKSENDLYFVFSVQEEVGLRGARTAAFGIDPDYGVAVDVTVGDDAPGTKHSCSSRIGGGAAIKVMDSSVICHPKMVKTLKTLAEQGSIPHQMDVITAGGTDAGAIHQTRAGVQTGGISIPCRYIHSPAELVDRGDVEACVKLVSAFAQTQLS